VCVWRFHASRLLAGRPAAQRALLLHVKSNPVSGKFRGLNGGRLQGPGGGGGGGGGAANAPSRGAPPMSNASSMWQFSPMRERRPMTEWVMVVPARTTQPSPRMLLVTSASSTLLGGRKRLIV